MISGRLLVTNKNDSIKIITLNVEGVKSNISYIHSLKLEKSILCLQEHFLWEFQKEHLKNLIYSSDEFVLCVGKYALMMHIFILVTMVISMIRSLPSSSCLTLLLQSDGLDIETPACSRRVKKCIIRTNKNDSIKIITLNVEGVKSNI
jgi:hypothetical protein